MLEYFCIKKLDNIFGQHPGAVLHITSSRVNNFSKSDAAIVRLPPLPHCHTPPHLRPQSELDEITAFRALPDSDEEAGEPPSTDRVEEVDRGGGGDSPRRPLRPARRPSPAQESFRSRLKQKVSRAEVSGEVVSLYAGCSEFLQTQACVLL